MLAVASCATESRSLAEEMMIAAILGPLAETELRRALAVSEGDLGILIDSPITIAIYVLMVGAIVISAVQHLRTRTREKQVRKAKTEAVAVQAGAREDAG